MFKKIFKYILPILLISTILFSCIPITVSADSDISKLVVTGNVDPRVKAKGNSVALFFLNLDTGDEYLLYLHDYNNYKNTIDIKFGYYITHSAYVTGDFELKYDVEFVEFSAYGWTTAVNVRVGDPNYSGEITDVKDKHDLPGAIDRDKTNELLEEDGLPTVDWDAIDKELQIDSDGDGTPDVYDDDDDNDGVKDLFDDDVNGDGVSNKDETPDKGSDVKLPIKQEIFPDDDEKNPGQLGNDDGNKEDGDGNQGGLISDPDNDNNNNDDSDENNNNNQNTKGKKSYAIIFVLILIIACGIVLFLKWRNSLNSDDEEE